MKKLRLVSLFSMVLVSACITIPRIDKKDSRNNQFSQQLKDWMAVKHPQKIDTTTKQSKSDTTWGPWFLDTNLIKLPRNFSLQTYAPITNDDTIYFVGIDKGDAVYPDSNPFSTAGLWEIIDSPTKQPCNPKIYYGYVYIHDTTFRYLVNESQITGLTDQLVTSRDSTNTFTLKYTQEKSAGLIKLFVAIGLGILLILSIIIYFQKK